MSNDEGRPVVTPEQRSESLALELLEGIRKRPRVYVQHLSDATFLTLMGAYLELGLTWAGINRELTTAGYTLGAPEYCRERHARLVGLRHNTSGTRRVPKLSPRSRVRDGFDGEW